jgi:translocation and assembly module TamB
VLRLTLPSFRGEIANIGARYKLASGNLDVRDISARLLGGELTGTMLMRHISGDSQSQLHASLRGVSLAELKAMMPTPSLKRVTLGGTVSALADANWGKTFDNLVAHTDTSLQASIGPAAAATASTKAVPLQGLVHASYSAARKEIALANSYVRTPQTSITLNGIVSNRSSMQVRMQSNDLHELESLSEMFLTPAKQLGLYGTASFTGAVRGTTSAPQVTGQLSAANLTVRDSAFRLLRTQLALSPSLASLQNGELEFANRGAVKFNVSAGLRNWSFSNTSPINVALNASDLDIADLGKAAGQQLPATGTLSANVAVHGTELNPIGQGQLTLTNAKVSSESIQSLNVNFQGTGDAVHTKLTLRLPAGTAQGTATYFPKTQGYDAELRATGIRLDKLQTVKARSLQVTGILNINANGRGTFNNPQLSASVQIPKLQIQDQTINAINLQTNVADHLANVAFDAQAVNTILRGRGTVKLTGDYYANATLDTPAIPLQPLIALYVPSQAANITGTTELHGTLRGPLKNKSLVDAHLTIPTLRLNYKNTVQIGAASPIQIDYNKGAIELKRAVIRGTATDLQLQASIPTDKSQPASLLALGTVDLHLLQLLNPDIASSGQMRFDINSYGATADPNVQGKIEIVNATLATGDMPLGLQNGNGVLVLTKDRLNITQFKGEVGGGTVTARGGIVYKPSMAFDLALAGKGIRLLYPDGVREALDTNLTLTGSTEAALLNGQVKIDQLSFTPDFDLGDFIAQFSGEATPAPSQGFAQNLQMNVAVQSTTGVNLVSRTLSVQGSANLQVRGTAAQPVILGRVNLSGGDLIFRGNRYVLEGGNLDFVNPAQTQPVVNVAINTTIQQYNVRLRFEGPVDHLHTNYSSDPALPPSDIINLLAFGKTTESSTAEAAQPGNFGAQSLIASGVSSQVTSRVEKIAGISQLSIDPVLGSRGGQQNPSARVTIQQRVTSNLFVTFATDVTSTQRQAIQLQYQVSPRLSISGTRNQNGGFGFDTRIKKSW